MQVKVRPIPRTANTDLGIAVEEGCRGGAIFGVGVRELTGVVLSLVLGKVVGVNEIFCGFGGQVCGGLAFCGAGVVEEAVWAGGDGLALFGCLVEDLVGLACRIRFACLGCQIEELAWWAGRCFLAFFLG